MPLKYEKQTKTNTEITYTFTGFEFERACKEAGVTASRLSKITRRQYIRQDSKGGVQKKTKRLK